MCTWKKKKKLSEASPQFSHWLFFETSGSSLCEASFTVSRQAADVGACWQFLQGWSDAQRSASITSVCVSAEERNASSHLRSWNTLRSQHHCRDTTRFKRVRSSAAPHQQHWRKFKCHNKGDKMAPCHAPVFRVLTCDSCKTLKQTQVFEFYRFTNSHESTN